MSLQFPYCVDPPAHLQAVELDMAVSKMPRSILLVLIQRQPLLNHYQGEALVKSCSEALASVHIGKFPFLTGCENHVLGRVKGLVPLELSMLVQEPPL